MFRIFLVSEDVIIARLIYGLIELFGGSYWYWVATRVFLFWVLVIVLILLRRYTASSLLHSAEDRDIGKAVMLVAREMLKLKPVWFRLWYLNLIGFA